MPKLTSVVLDGCDSSQIDLTAIANLNSLSLRNTVITTFACNTWTKDITLNDRIYKCNNCGYKEDRDIHSANNMIIMIKLVNNQINLVPTGHRDFKPVETNTTISKTSETSIVHEAGSSRIHRE